ncbi:mechanosensitive ion channel-like protein [Litorimonas taeanensis]|uniref:Mechanosensitive ion channel-like protein n=1 Tax=Litorimonas taeanensis TaxID=568099 RepID=A0A420WEL0_9PROT|nr:mechanosensitive ion channel domain-containing protein [Litorimonas taeanensis]RKQ69370.1 mechanosensitive ion channel-like protein [Litorimonas taeanensis]
MAALRTILCFILFWAFTSQTIWAQDENAAPPVTQPSVSEPVTAEEEPALPEQNATQTQSIDLDDPAIKAALEARAAADKALVEAIRLQQEATEENSEANQDPIAEKDSVFPTSGAEIKALGEKVLNKILGWLSSVPFLAQIGAIITAYFLAPIFAGVLKKRLFLFRSEPAKDVKLKAVRDIIYRARNLLRPIFLVALLALFAVVLKNIPIAGQDWLVKLVQGLAVVFLLFSAIKDFAPNDLTRKVATWVLIPLALLMVFGYYDEFKGLLNSTELMAMGGKPITLMTVILLLIFGVIFFKLGNLLNARGQDAIRAQDNLDVTTREVAAKIFQILIFALVFILVLGAAKVPLSGLVVIFSALSLGIGLGLQPIAANFVSGLIILFDRSVKVGDFVMMEGENFGRVRAINMRSTTVATADGKDIIVPNTSFTEGAYENWTHDNPLQRYEVDFGVAYDTDLDALVPIIRDAVLEHPDVLGEPDLPSVEFRSFGDSAINMCVEFWCEGVDDGPNKFTSDVGFIIWRALKAHKIEIPFPQRVVYTKK